MGMSFGNGLGRIKSGLVLNVLKYLKIFMSVKLLTSMPLLFAHFDLLSQYYSLTKKFFTLIKIKKIKLLI